MFPRIVKESDNKIRLTGSWLTEIGELDTAGKYIFFSHTPHFIPMYIWVRIVFYVFAGWKVLMCSRKEGKGDGADKGKWEPGIT